MSEEQHEGIAIIGMAGRFPGAASVEELWANLIAGKESISFFSDQELVESGLDPAEVRRRGHYVAARGVLEDADCFDAAFFGIHPKEAEVMDPQQRVFLETCWAALECAGYPPGHMRGAVGVFGGATYNTYHRHALVRRPDLIELVGSDLVMFCNEKDYLTTRVAYKLGLKGPALNISTACSTSLVAVCQAHQSLLTYQCDVALAGGVSVTVPQKRGYFHDEGNIGSADGHTRSFDAQASGTAFGNGVAVVVLKRLEDAVKDGDRIYAVIKGAALNNDGSQRVSFGAPGVEGQSEVIAMAHALAGVDPETITCVEAHGTATPLGDPIEVAALTKAFRLGTEAKQYCALGSIKSNLGHMDVAAGVTGLIKMALSLHHGVIPASLHFTKPNPKLDLENSPFYVNATLQNWKTKPGVPRRAGVSSFGTGGTNAHVVLEEAPELAPSGPSRPYQLLPISAKTSEALDRATSNLSAYLKSLIQNCANGEGPRRLADAAFTLQTGRSEFVHRRIVACHDAADGVAALEAYDPKRVFTYRQQLSEPPIVFMFPGQGAQYPGMGAEIYRTEPLFRAEVDHCAEVLQPILMTDLRQVMFPAAGGEKESDALLVQTRFTQPALFVIEYALAKLWMSWGIKPAAMIGHSVGEYVAGCLAGVFSLDDALTLVARRGALVQAQPGGAMLAIRLPEKDVLPLLPEGVAIAAINSPNLCVASGPHEAVESLEKQLEDKGVKVRHLHTSHAFHSEMMDAVLEPFTALLRKVKLAPPSIPYVSNVSARWITAQEAEAPEYWAGHVRQTVRFSDGIAELMKDPHQVLLEVGPGHTLCTLARQHPAKQAEQGVFASLPLAGDQELRGLTETLGRLWMIGVAVDWQGYYANEQRRRTVLPTYPFERKRYWPETSQRAEISGPATTSAMPVCGDAVPSTLVLPTAQPLSGSVPVSTLKVEPDIPRKERLLVEVRGLMQELSGYDFSNVDPSTDLLELGLDSLLLTQAAQLIQRKFKVQITFRQLMEELSALDAIASHVDASLPPEVYSQEGMMPVEVPQPTQGSSVLAGTIPHSVLEQILQQQQQLTNQVLQLMGRQPSVLPASIPSVSVLTQPTGGAPLLSSKPEGKSHGPFKPFDKNASTVLPEGQKRALDALIARYTGRTAGSKKLVADNRATLADPRSVAGFNRLWKEMVYPIVSTRSEGSKVWDVDGNEYVDFVMGFGASLFGHRPPFVVKAVHEQLNLGFEIGPIQPLAYEVAALMKEFTGMDRIGFTNTGSESVLAAIRVTRTVSGRDKIAVFAGAYHGIFDEVLFRPLMVNGEMRTAAIAPGIPDSGLAQVIVLDYGNPQSLEILRSRGSEIAAVFVETVQSRRLDLQPKEFLHELRRITKETGTALVFDEVVTGFRIHPGGAQAYFGVRADIATYGKVVGGGLPIGVVAGEKRYMDALDGGQWQYGDASFPEVGVTFFAGTCVRHPLALAAAKSVLTHLKQSGPQLQKGLADRTAKLADELRAVIEEFQAPYHLAQFSSLMTLTFPPDQKLAGLLFYLLRERGILIWENRNFVMTTAHTEEDLVKLVTAFRESLADMCSGGFLPTTSNAGEKVSGSRSVDSTDRFPLTEAQKEIWLAAQMGGSAAIAYNESLSLRFRGSFKEEMFRLAVHQAVQRHPILLAKISKDGHWQEVPSDKDVEIPVIDLSTLDEVAANRELDAVVDKEGLEPFDLVVGPLLRVKMVKLSEVDHVVLWTAHHIVCDGWSGGLLVSELARIYSAQMRGEPPALEEPVSFQAYAQEIRTDSPSNREAIEYWRDQFAELPPLLDLPVDHPRPKVRSAKAATLKKNFDMTLLQSLKRLAGQQRTTMVVLLMAGFKTLMHRLSGQTDIVLGLGAAGQAITGKTCLVGHCVNLLPIRTRLQPDASFKESLGAIKKSVLDAYDHHQCTMGNLLQHISVPRNASRPPLVEVIFNVDRDSGTADFDGVDFSCERNAKQALHFDLFFNFVEGPRGLYLECDYNTDLFNSTTIDRWLLHYESLLRGIVANPEERLDKLPILTEAERNELIVEWNKTDVGIPKDQTLSQWFEQQVEQAPNASAVSYEGSRLTYQELNRRATQVAHYLRTLGVGPNVCVGLFVERSIEMVVGILGILKAGGAYVPIDPVYPMDRRAFMLEDSGAVIVLTQSTLAKELPDGKRKIICLDTDLEAFASQSETNLRPSPSPDNLAYVIYTSGSTGKPKGTLVTHHNVVRLMRATEQWYHFNQRDVWTFFHSCAFDFSVWELWGALLYGGHVVVVPYLTSRSPKEFYKLLVDEGVTVLNQTPSAFKLLMEAESGSGTEIPLALRYVIFGGEALEMRSLKPWFDRHGDQQPRLINMYGITETTVHVTYRPISSADVTSGSVIGVPIPDLQVYILDAQQQPVPIGVAGEIYVGGAGVSRGYLNRKELTSERFLPDFFTHKPDGCLYRSGDLARYLPTRDIEYLGRIDQQVKIRGFRIELEEIQKVLEGHEQVRQCLVLAHEHRSGDKVLVAYFEPHTGMAPSASDLRAHMKRELPEYMLPSTFVQLERFPLTANGKIDRKALPFHSFEQLQASKEFVEPRTETEKALAAIWNNVLKVDHIGIHDDFFDLGGHSLLVIRAVSQIRDLFTIDLSPRTFFANPTISGLARALGEAQDSGGNVQRIDRRTQRGPCPLSFAQERIWFLDQLVPGSPAYNIVDVIRFEEVLDTNAMKRAINELVRRHESLRTNFHITDGALVQVVNPVIEMSLPQIDLRALSEREQEHEWIRVAQESGRTPFDLSQLPLMRWTSVQLPQEHLLLLTIHHIIADEWSMEVIHKELHHIYEAYSQGTEVTLPELPIQYTDFTHWQRNWLQGVVLQRQIVYWKEELTGAPALLELPTDKPRPAAQSFKGSTEIFKLPKSLLERLKFLGREEQATLFMTLEAGFMALMHRYTGQDDVLVGSPISGRTRSETESLIGMFLNSVVLRATFTRDLTFRSLLKQVREKALGAYSHQDLPFEQLVAELAPERTSSHSPLFQVMFILNNAQTASHASNVVGMRQLETATSKFDLTLYISEGEDGLTGLMEYSTDLFESNTIQRMCGHYGTLLEGIVKNPDLRISMLSMLPEDERQQLLVNWNSTEVVYPESSRRLHELIEAQVSKTPDYVALVVDQQKVTYGVLNQRANQLAHHLKRLGVGPDVLVGLCMERSMEMVVGLLGILKAGGAYVPLDPSFPHDRLTYMVEDSGMRVLVTHRDQHEKLPVQTISVVNLDSDWESIATGNDENLKLQEGNSSDLAYVLYTSGSTGKPKGVEIPHSALVNFLLSMQREPGFTSTDTLFAVTTISFDIAGLELYLPLISGGTVVIASRNDTQDPAKLSEGIRSSHCNVVQATPATWWALIHAGWTGAKNLKLLCGGEPLTEDLAKELLSRCAELWNMYGPTETTVWSAIHRVTSVDGPASIGRPIANTQVFVLDANCNIVPVGVVGELHIGGLGLARGYLGHSTLTQERFIASPFAPNERLYRTGDLARWLSDGTLDCLGRVDNQVKVRGFRIELGEVEAVLSTHEAVRLCVAAVHEKTPGNKALVVYFETTTGLSPAVSDLRVHLKKELPDYMVPSIFVALEKLPLTPNGKINRKALTLPDEVRTEIQGGYIAPQDSIEQLLAHLWAKVLGVKRVGLRDNFFDLGGHSLLAVRIVIEIEKLCKKRLPLVTFLQAPTVGELAEMLRRENWKPSWSSLVPLRPGGARSPLFLMHAHGGNVLEYYPLANHLEEDQPVYAIQAYGLDGNIVNGESLETIASSYVKELRSLQPQGPYFLGGFCFGGLLALETAQQLRASGEEVALLILIQTVHPAGDRFRSDVGSSMRWLYRTITRINIERERVFSGKKGYFHERFRHAVDLVRARAAVAYDRFMGNSSANRTTKSFPYILELLRIKHDQVAETYEPRPYGGDVLLIRVEKRLPGLVADFAYLGWKGVLHGNLEICDLPGHQQTLLLEPKVTRLAKELTVRLRAVQERRTVSFPERLAS